MSRVSYNLFLLPALIFRSSFVLAAVLLLVAALAQLRKDAISSQSD